MREFTITAKDGLELSACAFEAENPKAVVQIIHGLQEHKERYYDFAAFLLTKGYTSIITDLRGHGHSVNARFFLGHFDGSVQVADDQVRVLEYIKETYPGTDIYMFGHSYGSMIARMIIKEHDSEIKKLVTTGTVMPFTGARFAQAVCSLSAKIHHANSVKGLISSLVNSPNDSWIFTNYTAAAAYRADPLVQGCKFTNGAIRSVVEADALMKKTPLHKCANPGLRILIASGEKDIATGGRSGIKNTIKYLRRDGYGYIFTVSYPGDKHSILNEMDKEEIFKDIAMFFSD